MSKRKLNPMPHELRNRKHGMRSSSEYRIWSLIKHRCHCDRSPLYKYYGGRGISMCVRWREAFTAFLEDMGPRPSLAHSVERRDNNQGYSKDNCYWATDLEQARNKRNNRLLTLNGFSKPLKQWAEEMGISQHTLHTRLKIGWSVERALTELPRPKDQTFRIKLGMKVRSI